MPMSEPAADDRLLLQIAGSAGDVKDRADLPSLEARDQPAGLFRRDSDKVNVSARGLRHHLGHDRQRAVGPCADDQLGSAPRELLVGRERSVSELAAVWLRGLLAPFAHGTSADDDVVLVRASLDLDRPEPEKSHIHHAPPGAHTSPRCASSPVWFFNSTLKRFITTPLRRDIQHFGIYADCQCAESRCARRLRPWRRARREPRGRAEPAMRAVTSRGDDPERKPALIAGGHDECQLLRPGGTPPTVWIASDTSPWLPLVQENRRAGPPGGSRRTCSTGHSPCGAARQQPHLGPPPARGRDQASSNSSLTDTAPGPVASTAHNTTPVPLPSQERIVRDQICRVTSENPPISHSPNMSHCRKCGDAGDDALFTVSATRWCRRRPSPCRTLGCRLRRTGVGAVRGESSL